MNNVDECTKDRRENANGKEGGKKRKRGKNDKSEENFHFT